MRSLPPYPGGKEVFRHLLVAVPQTVGMVQGARILLEWSDDGTTATLILGNRRVSRAQAELDRLDSNHPPKFVRRGRDWFLTFWTGCATCVDQNYVLLGRRSLEQKGGFENAWTPRFEKNGVVYAYPRHIDYDEQQEVERKLGYRVRVQEVFRWNTKSHRFVPAGHAYLRNLPPIPGWRFRNT